MSSPIPCRVCPDGGAHVKFNHSSHLSDEVAVAGWCARPVLLTLEEPISG